MPSRSNAQANTALSEAIFSELFAVPAFDPSACHTHTNSPPLTTWLVFLHQTLHNLDLPTTAQILFACMAGLTRRGERLCYASQSRLACLLGVVEKTISKFTKVLTRLGWLEPVAPAQLPAYARQKQLCGFISLPLKRLDAERASGCHTTNFELLPDSMLTVDKLEHGAIVLYARLMRDSVGGNFYMSKTYKELASIYETDPRAISRYMRALIDAKHIQEVRAGTYFLKTAADLRARWQARKLESASSPPPSATNTNDVTETPVHGRRRETQIIPKPATFFSDNITNKTYRKSVAPAVNQILACEVNGFVNCPSSDDFSDETVALSLIREAEEAEATKTKTKIVQQESIAEKKVFTTDPQILSPNEKTSPEDVSFSKKPRRERSFFVKARDIYPKARQWLSSAIGLQWLDDKDIKPRVDFIESYFTEENDVTAETIWAELYGYNKYKPLDDVAAGMTFSVRKFCREHKREWEALYQRRCAAHEAKAVPQTYYFASLPPTEPPMSSIKTTEISTAPKHTETAIEILRRGGFTQPSKQECEIWQNHPDLVGRAVALSSVIGTVVLQLSDSLRREAMQYLQTNYVNFVETVEVDTVQDGARESDQDIANLQKSIAVMAQVFRFVEEVNRCVRR